MMMGMIRCDLDVLDGTFIGYSLQGRFGDFATSLSSRVGLDACRERGFGT